MKKRIKSVISLLLCLLIFLSVPSTVYAKTYEISGITIDATYEDDNDDSHTIRATTQVPYWFFNNNLQRRFTNIKVVQNGRFNFNDEDTITLTLSIGSGENRYWGFGEFDIFIFSAENEYKKSVYADSFELQRPDRNSPGSWYYNIHDNSYVEYDYKTATFTYSLTVEDGYDDCYVDIRLYNPYYNSSFNTSTGTFAFGVTDFNIETESYATSMFAQISDFFAGLADKLTSWFNNLFQWLKDIRDNATEGFSNIGKWFENLGNNIKTWFDNLSNNIKGFFTDLGNKISGFFTDLKNNLKTWFDNIGNWFTEIGDKISGFFEKLWNRIYWGNENGESEYQKPVINNKLNDILDTMDGYQNQLKDTISTINTSAEQVSTYISTGTQLIEGVISVGGVGLTALIVFGMVFILVRKVVGR